MQFFQVPNRSLSDLDGHSTGWDGLCLYLPRTVLGHPTCLLSVPSQNSGLGGLKFTELLTEEMRHLSLAFAVQKQLKWGFFAAVLPVVTCRQKPGFWKKEQADLAYSVPFSSPLPKLSPGVTLVACLWPGICG